MKVRPHISIVKNTIELSIKIDSLLAIATSLDACKARSGPGAVVRLNARLVPGVIF